MKKPNKEIEEKIKKLRQEADTLEKLLTPIRNPHQKYMIQSLKERVKEVGKPLKLEWRPQSTINLSKVDVSFDWIEISDGEIFIDYCDIEQDIDDQINELHDKLEKEFNRWVVNCPQLKQRNKEIKEVLNQVEKAAEELEMDNYDLMNEVGI